MKLCGSTLPLSLFNIVAFFRKMEEKITVNKNTIKRRFTYLSVTHKSNRMGLKDKFRKSSPKFFKIFSVECFFLIPSFLISLKCTEIK